MFPQIVFQRLATSVIMFLNSILLLAPLLVAALVEAGTRGHPKDHTQVYRREQGLELTKRDCSDDGCTCQPNYGGAYCADCVDSNNEYIILDLGSNGTESNLYSCDGSGGCCDYGYANQCANGATGSCG